MSAYKNKFLLIQIVFCFISTFSIGQNLPSSKHKLIVIAHRGNHTNVPENTLASIDEAIKYGVDYVEVDLRTTKDGYLIIHHDGTVDRATNGKGKISDHTLEEIKKLQVFNQNKKTYKIPEFRDVLKLCKNKINIYLDFKDADVAQTWKQIQEAGMEKQIVVYINKKEQYPQWKSIAPQMPLMTSIPDEIKSTDQLSSFLNEIKISVIDNVVNPEMEKIIKEKKISTWLDVQSPTEGPASWDEAISKGVQGLQTDHPEALIEYLNKKGLR
ncbi:glycerophosphodiester phosphodiesterase family protein [Dyadobacter frigoris]|uniref:Glycerophosphodiester phosphodiesterase family protein n=1 Tax=Dyadobacter frigoris TaxID=2576211 RepID=A0A4U6D8B8_9BACT|nr:glycerophosphodiester phosphodiesterase family protein [Dyadobacter frigoris]TKT93719.1 glycerophosphodiester phosphodiesterase family protein [Dyadobacter frigoris]GLU51070.1 glycerophosphoryl diester phosphodiesterase [Dyadobacter frigoris]